MDILNIVWLLALIVLMSAGALVLGVSFLYIRSLLRESRLRYAHAVVKRTVQALEQLALSRAMPYQGGEKKHAVMHMLKEVENIDLDPELLDFLVEGVVWEEFNFFKDPVEIADEEKRHIPG